MTPADAVAGSSLQTRHSADEFEARMRTLPGWALGIGGLTVRVPLQPGIFGSCQFEESVRSCRLQAK
jgi:hypothetical protein